MRFNLVGGAIHDVHASAIRLPARDSSRKVIIGICHSAVVLFFEFVFFCIGGWIAALPEGFNELIALFIVGELFESRLFLVSDDPGNILIEPIAVVFTQFVLEGLGVFFFLLIGDGSFKRVDVLTCWR